MQIIICTYCLPKWDDIVWQGYFGKDFVKRRHVIIIWWPVSFQHAFEDAWICKWHLPPQSLFKKWEPTPITYIYRWCSPLASMTTSSSVYVHHQEHFRRFVWWKTMTLYSNVASGIKGMTVVCTWNSISPAGCTVHRPLVQI